MLLLLMCALFVHACVHLSVYICLWVCVRKAMPVWFVLSLYVLCVHLHVRALCL